MKNVKKRTSKLLLAFTVCSCSLGLCACGSKAPSDKAIKQDLENSLAETRSKLTLTEIKTDKGITEKKSYSATENVTAKSDFAVYHLTAEINYTRYDQGWKMDSCQWIPGEIEVEVEPTIEQMTEDVKTSLLDYKSYLEFENCSLNSSMVQDDIYTANITVSALSQYAEYELSADVTYGLNDDGWAFNNCAFTEADVQVVNYPDEETMTKMVNENAEMQKEEMDGQTCSKMTTESNKVIYEGSLSKVLNSFITKAGTVTSYWNYNSDTDSWDLENKNYDEKYELKGIEGEWEENGTIFFNISKYDGTGFDFSCPWENSNTVHVEFTGVHGSYLAYEGDGYVSDSCKEGTHICVLLRDWDYKLFCGLYAGKYIDGNLHAKSLMSVFRKPEA